MNAYTFDEPWWLALLVALPLIAWFRHRRGTEALVVPFAADWWKPAVVPASRLPTILALVGLTAVLVALARPQRLEGSNEVLKEGYDLMLAIDLSGSMLAEDYKKNGQQINRLEAIKPVIQSFIRNRPNDRIGLVVFAGRAYTLAPLTFDHEWLARQTEKLKIGLMEDGTAIGDGLGMALARLDVASRVEGKRTSAFVVLLTDGANNRGALKPRQAADIARVRGIPVFTIGAGKDGLAPFPILDGTGKKVGYRRIVSDLDEKAMQEVALATGGLYFRADNLDTADAAFKAIDETQKTQFQAKAHLRAKDLFLWPLALAIGCFASSALLVRLPWKEEALA